jgi:hypothetical protein
MPITDIRWKEGEGHDIHLLRGNLRLALRDAIEFQETDGSWVDASNYLLVSHDVVLSFRPSFKFVMDVTPTESVCVGFGIRINNETGRIETPAADPAINNFLVYVQAEDSSDPANHKFFHTHIRVHMHNRVTSAWLTPPVLTLRPSGAPLPEQTQVRFSVRAQFDDNTVGDITHHPNIIWRPTANVAGFGFLRINPGDNPGNPAIEIEAILPPDLEDFQNPNPPEIKATGHIRFAANWATAPTIRTEAVQIQDAWPGTINPELVPNFLFLCDGYKTEDQSRFEAQVRGLIGLMKTSQIARPFDLLSTSMNYFRAFVPSNHHGISVLCEVYPEQDAAGNIQVAGDGTVKFFCVDDPEEPPANGNWGLSHVIHRLGLPIPGQAGLTVAQIRDYWDSIVDGIPRNRISDGTVRAWRKLAKRTLLEETDSVFGQAYGNYPSSSLKSNNLEIGFHPRRMERARLDPILRRLADENGESMQAIWAERADGTRPNSYPLVFIFSSLKWDRGVNFGKNYVSMNVEERDWIPARAVAGKPTYEIDLTAKISNSISHGRLIRGCHEIAHSFGLGDEYNETGTMPQILEIDDFYGNLQRHSDIEDPATHRLTGENIKWRWHRIRKAAVLAGSIAELPNSRFRIPLILGQANQFAADDTVLLRIRVYPDPLPRNPHTSNQLKVLEVQDFTDPTTGPPEAFIIVEARPGHSFTFADAEAFDEGCVVYSPVRAKDSVFNETTYPFAELMAKNIMDHITVRNRALNRDPDVPEACAHDSNEIQTPVKLSVDLPFCFRHKNRVVGLYTGGRKYDCGIYHPAGNCIMRNSNENAKEFCAVCRYLLVDIINPFHHFSLDLEYEKRYPQT